MVRIVDEVLLRATQHALMITGFVMVMMLVIEYLNVLTRGAWQERLRQHRWGQYLLAAVLGLTPGCLGAFVMVALYSHQVVTFGALVTTMIATSGDESFVMMAMFPTKALWLMALLGAIGIPIGIVADLALRGRRTQQALACEGFDFHEAAACDCLPQGRIVQQWRECSSARGILSSVLGLFVAAVLVGQIGPEEWNWIRVTLVMVGSAGLFIVATVPDHFLEEHLWKHVAKQHVPRVFLWTLGALILVELLQSHLSVQAWLQQSRLPVMLIACLVGIIPESGPHLVFVTLYARGMTPFSVLLASSIVQDGHGMLPMLAHSGRAFVAVKAINLLIGLVAGLLGYLMHW